MIFPMFRNRDRVAPVNACPPPTAPSSEGETPPEPVRHTVACRLDPELIAKLRRVARTIPRPDGERSPRSYILRAVLTPLLSERTLDRVLALRGATLFDRFERVFERGLAACETEDQASRG